MNESVRKGALQDNTHMTVIDGVPHGMLSSFFLYCENS